MRYTKKLMYVCMYVP